MNCYRINYYYLLSVGHNGTTIWCSTSLIKGCKFLSRSLLTPSYCCKDLMNRVWNFLQYTAAVDNRHCQNYFFLFFTLWCSESVPRGPHLIQHMSAEVDAGEIWTVNPRNMWHFYHWETPWVRPSCRTEPRTDVTSTLYRHNVCYIISLVQVLMHSTMNAYICLRWFRVYLCVCVGTCV